MAVPLATMMAEWTIAFTEKLKTKAFESISLLMFDEHEIAQDQVKQKLLNKLLMTDHKSVSLWAEYIDISFKANYPQKKLQLQRLVNKALEVLDEKELKDNRQYVSIHLHSADLKK